MAENYIVSARKYRPQTFDTVVGQEHITTTLKNAIRHQHLAHAYLFCGPRGVGKTTCARILAKTINCENPSADMEACGVCTSCQSFSNNASFNIFELDAASNNSVEDIRELVNQVRFAPQQGKYKIYIIDEVHMLSANAFNAFLKTLEEPPSYAIFILATTEKHKILPTILSRCQIFDFKRIVTQDIVHHLQGIASKEAMTAQEAALHVIAQKSEGCMRDALSMLDRIAGFTDNQLTYASTMEHLNMLDADFYFNLTDQLLSQDVSGALVTLDNILERGFEGNVILEGLSAHLRNLLLCKDQRMAKLLDVPNEHKPIYYEKANQVPPSFILSALNALNDSELNYRNANNKRLHVEMCLIKLCYMLQATKVDEKKNLSVNQISPTPKPPSPPQKIVTPAVQTTVEPEIPLNAAQETITTLPLQALPPQPATNGARRVGKDLLKNIDAALSTTTAQAAQPHKDLEEQEVLELLDIYVNKLRANNQTNLAAQFSMMKVSVVGIDEVKFTAPTKFVEEYAKEQRNMLIDYFSSKTGVRVRVTTETIEQPEIAIEPTEKVMSKQDVFAAMVAKNPSLQHLKDALNLQLDY